MMSKILILNLLLGLSACSLFQRHEHSGYANDDSYETSSLKEYYNDRKLYEYSQTKEELGYTTRTLSEQEYREISTRIHLKRLESGLSYSVEKKQYYKYKPYFRNDDERVYFLSLPDLKSRKRWAAHKGLAGRTKIFTPNIASAIETKDIIVGMTKNAVQESWGAPDIIEVAGNPIYGNERWLYNKMVSSNDGYNKQQRAIYFESGRVAGWETH